ncbi:hypothetical protein WJ28_17525 [Burkholderia thailandensis]|nr:hypothetical protein WJ27_03110 [Burkholderia thailandensis]KVG11779.1 hypothetical protein WJ25_08785 [Burkholderia thailandensis]KVG14115.1 hypothetical protein WJ28_17525 [Burkholderia thailandensis]NOK44250.1 hypothetical protein [Burkholderia thailandensis]NOK55104.1 hypothetical protein [Burkholderia thailandensis]
MRAPLAHADRAEHALDRVGARPGTTPCSSADSSAAPSKAAVSAIATAGRTDRTHRAFGPRDGRLGTEAIDASPKTASRVHFERAFD